jgi:ABC-2 type transport system permease protein
MTLTHHVHADVSAFTRSRSVQVVAASALFLGAVLTGALVLTHGTDEPVADLTTAFGQGEVLVDPITGLVLAALVAAYWGSSYRDGSILWSFLASPSRVRVAASGLLASALLGLAVGLATVVVKVVTLHVTLPAGAVASWWQDPHGQTAVAGALLAAVVLAVVAAAASLVTRSAPVAIAVIFGWMLVVEPLLVGLLPRSAWTWLPAHALSAIRNAVPDVDLVRAGTMVALYTALAVVAALVVTARRDPA